MDNVARTAFNTLSQEDLRKREQTLDADYRRFQEAGLALDLTRGKPNPAQVALSDELDAAGDGWIASDGTDTRNYGGLDGLPEARALGAAMLDVAVVPNPAPMTIGTSETRAAGSGVHWRTVRSSDCA